MTRAFRTQARPTIVAAQSSAPLAAFYDRCVVSGYHPATCGAHAHASPAGVLLVLLAITELQRHGDVGVHVLNSMTVTGCDDVAR